MHWHQQDINETEAALKTGPQGLSADEARQRLKTYGPNELRAEKKRTVIMMFLDQFRDFMVLVLIAAAIISGVIGEASDTAAIIVIVALNAVIGFIQEFRAERAMATLKKMAAAEAVVCRDGSLQHVPAALVVPGDLVLLEAGGIVPADLRLCEAAQLKVEEATLTGESLPVEKHTRPLPDAELPLGDRKNMAYKGTVVSSGRAAGIAVATGMDTELGRIAALLQTGEQRQTPLQKRLAAFGARLAIAVLVICAIIFGAGLLRGEPPLLMLLTAISLAVAAIPEALPAVVTISLAIGARKMVRENALVRKLPAVETLGSVTCVCSDKTGTLTLNRMTVEEIWTDGQLLKAAELAGWKAIRGEASGLPHLPALFTALALNNDARPDASGKLIGDPTETALYRTAEHHGFRKQELEAAFPRALEVPFDSERKCMTTFHVQTGGRFPWDESAGYVALTKGAVESLIEKSDYMAVPSGRVPINRRQFHGINDRMAADGLRVLGIAVRTWQTLPEALDPEQVETGLTMIGLVGLMDPPRPEAGEAVRLCRSAGIRPIMITGDHPLTARAIAGRLGIIDDADAAILTGRELSRLSLEEFEGKVAEIKVYARVAPEQKLKIVRALQDQGQFVAMTGDGVNDAPALQSADIGVAMGVTGTDVAKEAAHLILLDDNFATIVRAVREGRKIYDNIRKFIRYLLTTNSGEIWTLFLAPLFGLPLPLLPIQILWINLVTDGLPALALSTEPAEGDVMRRPPRHPKESIFSHGLGIHAIWVGLLMAGITLLVQTWAIKTGDAHWQTMVFTILCLTQLGHVLAIRSEHASLFTMGLFSNKFLAGAVILTTALQLATVYVPQLNPIFKTTPLSPAELGIVLAASSLVFFAVEIEKLIRRRMVS